MLKKIILMILFVPFLVGYKVYSNGNTWPIIKSDSKIYLKFCQNVTIEENDVASGDALHGQTITQALFVDSIVDDFTDIASSYVSLADAATDNSFSSTTHADRIIEVCNGGVGNMAGFAQQKTDSEGNVIGCTITLGSLSGKAKELLRVITHEVGHCLGLDHPQESKYAVMSYFSSQTDVYRLQNDDKAGLAYLYPNDSGYSRVNTFGASCAAKN